MSSFENLPKLIYKKHYKAFSKRDKENKLTSEDLDDWIESLEWIATTMKEFQESKASKIQANWDPT